MLFFCSFIQIIFYQILAVRSFNTLSQLEVQDDNVQTCVHIFESDFSTLYKILIL